mmetsp:Transcript_16893/g.39294  ORF Transcript_16893/g.39294 Transcript_16893/m.39294 type:complete len:1044 (+) Transcript_16893:93-3224(+)
MAETRTVRSQSEGAATASQADIMPVQVDGDEESTDTALPAVQVCVRLRPLLTWEKSEGHEWSSLDFQDMAGGSVTLRRPEKTDLSTGTSTSSSDSGKTRSFRFDAVFGPDRTQQDVWDQVRLRSLIESVVGGFHVTIFAYGQTGSGKTHTMEGFTYEHFNGNSAPSASSARPRVALKASSPDQLGIVPRAIQELFARLEAVEPDKSGTGEPESPPADDIYTVKVSFLQIYKERIYDLLNPMHTPAQREVGKGEEYTGLRLRWDAGKHQFFVENLFEYECATAEDVMQHYSSGIRNKQVASTSMNVASSRSHTILVLTVLHRTRCVEMPTRAGGTAAPLPLKEVVSKLVLVDLAGSERSAASMSNTATDRNSARFQEAVNINQSLFVLRKVITALSKRSEAKSSDVGAHVPYRESKLTSLLQHAIGGNSFLVMFACLSPSDKHFEENLSTLQYASQAASIKNTPVLNLDPKDRLIAQLREQLAAAHAYILRVTGLSELPAELLAQCTSRQRSAKRRAPNQGRKSGGQDHTGGSSNGFAAAQNDFTAPGGQRDTSGQDWLHHSREQFGRPRPSSGPGVFRNAGMLNRAAGDNRRDPSALEATARSESASSCDALHAPRSQRSQPLTARLTRGSVEAPSTGCKSSRTRPPSMPPPGEKADNLPPIPSGGDLGRSERKQATQASQPSPYDLHAGTAKNAASNSATTSRTQPQRRSSGASQPTPRGAVPRSSSKAEPLERLDELDEVPRPVHDTCALLDALRQYQPPHGTAGASSPEGNSDDARGAQRGNGDNKEWSGLWEAVEELRHTKSGLEVQLQMAESRATELQAKLWELQKSGAADNTTAAISTEVLEAPTVAEPTVAPRAKNTAWATQTSPTTVRNLAGGPPAADADNATTKEVTATHLTETTAERDRLRGENVALRREQASLLERLEVFEKLMEMDVSTEVSAEHGCIQDSNEEDTSDKMPQAKGLRDKAETFHARLIIEAAALRKEVASLKKKKWIVRSLLANGGEQEKRALEEEVAELRRTKALDPNSRGHESIVEHAF